MAVPENTLIVGVESKIGSALAADMNKSGWNYTGSTRHLENGNLLNLDLASSPETWKLSGAIDAAVICAGVTNIEVCEADLEYTSRVNVSGSIDLAKVLMAQGAYVIFLSTNMVFDGSEKAPGTEEKPNPTTEYGLQKAKAESGILQIGKRSSVLRMTKVFGPVNPLIEKWKAALIKGVAIKAFSDKYLAPAPVFCVTQAIKYLLNQKAPGIWHLSGDRDISYFDMARSGALAIDADPSLIQSAVSPTKYQHTRRTILDMQKLHEAAKLLPPTVYKTVRAAFTEKESLADASADVWRE